MLLTELSPNVGQIAGVPSNPRTITPEDFASLKKSLKNFRKMLALRPIVVDENKVILGGNMRYKALCKLAEEKAKSENYQFGQDIPDEWVRVATDLTPEEKMRFIKEDNQERGQWDFDKLANEWEQSKLKEWDAPVANWQERETLNETETGNDGLQEGEGEDTNEPERIIIVYPNERKEELEAFIGITISKPRYTFDEIKNNIIEQ